MSNPIELPEWAEELFKPYRNKVAWGGRGSSKSWSFAKALLIKGAKEKLRILCAREVQKSLKQSVHQLLHDQIQAMGLGNFYEVLESEIRGKNGTTFDFTGLLQHTVDTIKSYEGADIVWVEEAHSVSKKSWDILIPTIRKPGSEIWVSFNPNLDTDDTWKRFIENPPPRSLVLNVNFQDNPWFPPELEQERIHCLETDPEGYKTIWGGQCRSSIDGAIYAEEMAFAVKEGRITLLPYDPKAKVHAIWDLGWNDSTSIIMAQKIGPSALAVIDYLEDSQKTLDHYANELNRKPYNWGDWWLPHDATHKDLKTGTSVQLMLRKMRQGNRMPKITPNIGVEPGIRVARMTMRQCYFDKMKTARLIECLKRYRRSIPISTGEPAAPVHDEFSHGADAFRYMGVVADQLSNEEVNPFSGAPVISYGVLDQEIGV